MDELTKQYNEACQRINAAVKAIREATDGADLAPLEAELNAATAEGERCAANLERRDQLDSVSDRFTPRAVDSPHNPNDLGMDAKEVRGYSLIRAINAAVSGDWSNAGLEREASDAVAKSLGRSPQGFFVPLDVQRQKRDMTVGTDSAGGYLVGTDLLSASFIDVLRNRLALKTAGATVLGGLVGDVAIPRKTAGTTFYWVAESGAPTESQPTLDQIALTPHTGGAYTDLSRKFLKQSSIDAENMIRQDLAATCATGIDLAGLHGTAANDQPRGLAATVGIGSVVGGENGAAPDWADIIDLETEVSVDNADFGALAYMTNAKVRGKLKKTLITATYGEDFIWDRRSPEAPLNGYPCHVTNQVSSTLTKGNQSASSAIFFGNWEDLVIAMWGTLDVLVDPYTGSTSGTVRVVALQDVDIAVRRAQSFAAMLDALTT